ncbi:hydrolase [Vibrio sp. 10N.286.49.C2]|uniref:hydrolase n=1 Tax=unclassified Vibrio TaxID=2614977 RepID=UPI000C82E3B5|nr:MULTISPECIES: hydrolase [unclassified Vibrio]PMH37886.1 hydrolase [Vibrio sp. 10N.286.49.C2]PMH53182.1 hydrolase [Vibrio sp. 10N.286.49.B1]PMH84019.1 hydrolase [Vibrio sp. 10N.286.48.B7]
MNTPTLQPFIAAKGLGNPHIQTLIPRFIRRRSLFDPVWETLETPDGDFVELAWSEDPHSDKAKHKPVFVLFHGLEGCFNSPYANGLMHAFAKQGWLAVMMHFRGCGPNLNRLARAYHSGEIGDARHFIELLDHRYPNAKKVAVGISLGGNMLTNYLAHYKTDTKLDSATIVSAPLDLAACSSRIEQGFSKLYRRYLLSSMKKNALLKTHLLSEALGLTAARIKEMKRLYEFDDLITAPLHGFKDADDYYQRCSALPRLNDIVIPTQFIHAKDDPFMNHEVIPDYELTPHLSYRLLEQGGHVGFLSGSWRKPVFWLEEVLPSYYRHLAE